MTSSPPLTFGAIEDTSLPLAVLAHGFPDTPFTWRHLGPDLAARGFRVAAPWLPGYDVATDQAISVGTYARHLLDVRRRYDGDERAVLIGVGHFLHLEKPELVAAKIVDWLGV